MNLLCSSFKVYKPKNGSQGVSKAAFFLEAPGEKLFLRTFQLLQAACIPWIMALFFHLQSQQQLMGFFLHLIPPPNLALLPLPHLRTLITQSLPR